VKRRDFIVRSTVLALAPGGLAACAHAQEPAPPTGWDAVRASFALSPGEHNLTAWWFASHPEPVRAAIERHRAGLDSDSRRYLTQREALEDDVRAAAAAYLETSPDQVALTDSTTMGLGLLYAGILLRPGAELVTSTHDFYATHEALRLRAERDGCTLTKVELYSRPDETSIDEIVSNVGLALGPATRVLALTWVHSSTGVKLPVREIADVVAHANRDRAPAEQILFCLDGVHGFGCEAATPDELGVDFLVTGCHKWLFGPRGTGLVWGTPLAWSTVKPTIPTFDQQEYFAWMYEQPTALPAGPLETPGGFHSMEHRWALKETFEWRQRLGRHAVERRTHELVERLKAGLDGARHLALATPRDARLSAGMVMTVAYRRDPGEVVERLYDRHRIVASVTPYREAFVRVGPSIVNDEDEVDLTARALRELS
jgi:selenocysteine lyase/cysteine desulfurase